jgi:putative component of membrane protein insertase Oxa1/YidC/SpoIIIJ protein YidD
LRASSWSWVSALFLWSCGGAAPHVEPSGEGFAPWSGSVLYPVIEEREPLERGREQGRDAVTGGPASAGVWVLFAAYQTTWSRLDGPTCGFEPTCSRYALEVVSRWGPLGLPLAFGRLMRDHSHDGFYPVDERGRLVDQPPEGP